MDGLLFSLQELLEQAQAAFQEMCQQSKPEAPVMMHGESAQANVETIGSISDDQLSELTLPLAKAISILELFVDDLPCPEADGGQVAKDLIKEASQIAHVWAGFDRNKAA